MYFIINKNFKIFHITTTKQNGNMKDFSFRKDFCIKYNIDYSKIVFAQQTHSTNITIVTEKQANTFINNCDGLITTDKNIYLCIFTADCMPVFMFSKDKQVVALIHAGWRGLANGILNNAIVNLANNFSVKQDKISVYIGPHIEQCCYEIGAEVKKAFNLNDNITHISLTEQAKKQLYNLGITNIYASPYCTYHNNELFYSYRKEKTDNRMMSLISLRDTI